MGMSDISSEYMAEKEAVEQMLSRAMKALLVIWNGDSDLAKRVVRRVLDAPAGGDWKSGCPRSVIVATAKESGRSAHEMQQSIHIDDWTALANLPLFRPSLLGKFLADGLASIKANSARFVPVKP